RPAGRGGGRALSVPDAFSGGASATLFQGGGAPLPLDSSRFEVLPDFAHEVLLKDPRAHRGAALRRPPSAAFSLLAREAPHSVLDVARGEEGAAAGPRPGRDIHHIQNDVM